MFKMKTVIKLKIKPSLHKNNLHVLIIYLDTKTQKRFFSLFKFKQPHYKYLYVYFVCPSKEV